MKRKYEREQELRGQGITFIFQPGDRVLIKEHRAEKLLPKASGPHSFIRYGGGLGCTAHIFDGKRNRVVSAAHLVPWRE